ncbi:LysR family transcriptional regulator [Homoserinimonas sp. OAct 916]|uniref:LysR family transcriptional regulator n=1 Tax=Homoserinimonas sp. OAct 916 TaxID=2211450 RepID=UPI000DBE8522|nr:LysR family transcriptional regulator [Homoserinimonas sp. OAct 916]
MLGPHMPELSGLQLLVEVGESGSLSQAGRLLGVSQQAVSARMRSLERQVGAELIIRSQRGSTLTSTGRVVSEWAAAVLAAAERMDAGITSIRSESQRQLNVAASLTIAEYLLPRWLVTLRERQEAAAESTTTVGLVATNSDTVIELVRSADAAVGFIETSVIPAGLKCQIIGYDTLQVAVAPDHVWATRLVPVTAAELARTRLVTREQGSGTRQTFEKILTESGVDRLAPPRVELSSSAAVRTAIIAGTAPGVLSSLAIADDLALGRLVAVPAVGITLRRPLSAVWRSGATPPPGPAEELVTIAMAH